MQLHFKNKAGNTIVGPILGGPKSAGQVATNSYLVPRAVSGVTVYQNAWTAGGRLNAHGITLHLDDGSSVIMSNQPAGDWQYYSPISYNLVGFRCN
jgi:hypothetical protein